MEERDILVGGRDDDVWDERWKALSLAIDTMFNDYGQVPDTLRLKTLRPLLLCLKAFAGRRFADFHSGFLSKRLITWPDFPPDAVLSSIQDQIGFDVAAIDRAILQRVSGTSLMKERLALADRLAWSALQLAVSAGLLPANNSPTVVTYFQKAPEIRVIHYAPVALLGIPYSSQQLDRDLLATPHEVGHYVFGHGTYRGQPLRKYLVNQLAGIVLETDSRIYQMLLSWLDELFADVYGVCVAGPVMALDFQDLQLHAGREGFSTDDKDHPTPVLRPNIHVQILRKRDPERWGTWADVLERNWDVRLQERGRIDNGHKFDHFIRDNQSVAIVETISESANAHDDANPLDRLVTIILDVLKAGSTHSWYSNLPDAPLLGDQSLDLDALALTTEQLYQAFHDFVLHPPVVEPEQLDPLMAVPLSTAAEQNKVVEQWLDVDQLRFPAGGNVAPETWEPFFDADGWTTEGPNDRWP